MQSFSSIVGPNGSGKSNTIDALLFVFGYRASKMRQGKLSELIHNSARYPDLDEYSVEIHFREIITSYVPSLMTINCTKSLNPSSLDPTHIVSSRTHPSSSLARRPNPIPLGTRSIHDPPPTPRFKHSSKGAESTSRTSVSSSYRAKSSPSRR